MLSRRRQMLSRQRLANLQNKLNRVFFLGQERGIAKIRTIKICFVNFNFILFNTLKRDKNKCLIPLQFILCTQRPQKQLSTGG